VAKGFVYLQNTWIKPPNKNKKCHCGGKFKYKICCYDKDLKAIKDMIKNASSTRRATNGEDEARLIEQIEYLFI